MGTLSNTQLSVFKKVLYFSRFLQSEREIDLYWERRQMKRQPVRERRAWRFEGDGPQSVSLVPFCL
jgi:hypothetical protein